MRSSRSAPTEDLRLQYRPNIEPPLEREDCSPPTPTCTPPPQSAHPAGTPLSARRKAALEREEDAGARIVEDALYSADLNADVFDPVIDDDWEAAESGQEEDDEAAHPMDVDSVFKLCNANFKLLVRVAYLCTNVLKDISEVHKPRWSTLGCSNRNREVGGMNIRNRWLLVT